MSSYSDLIDVVLQKGMKHSDLLHAIHSSVLAAYKNKGYANADTVSVAVDEYSGVVTILEQSMDVTPEEFKKTAQEIAHQKICKPLKNTRNAQSSVLETTYLCMGIILLDIQYRGNFYIRRYRNVVGIEYSVLDRIGTDFFISNYLS